LRLELLDAFKPRQMFGRVCRAPSTFERPIQEAARDVEANRTRGQTGMVREFGQRPTIVHNRSIRRKADTVKYC
jgi:hypothetical protein